MFDPSIGVVDRIELQELIARYSIARDDKDMEALLACFTPRARFLRRGREVIGVDAIREFFAASMSGYDLTTHTTHNQVLDDAGDGAVSGLVTGHAELVKAGVLHLASYRYLDRYERHEGRWRIAERSLNFLYAMPVGELGAGFRDTLRIRWVGGRRTGS